MRISGHGIELDAPKGWEGRIYRRPEGFPILHAANFPLVADDGDFAGVSVEAMPPDGVVVVLAEFDPQAAGQALFPPVDLPVAVAASKASPRAMPRTIAGRSGVQRFFTLEGRPFCLYVVVGSAPSVRGLIERANGVLATLAVAPSPS